MTAPAAVEALRSAVQRASGWELGGARGDLFDGALARASASAGVSPEAHAAQLLRSGARGIEAFVAEASVGETYFFRDPAQWELVAGDVIPAAMARRGAAERTAFRAWSAGCSTGEEPYTLAMLLADRDLLDRALILASDLSPAALARARAAEYTQWSIRGGMDPRARRWLHEEDGKLRVDSRITAAVQTFELNLAEPSYPDPARGLVDLDLILCRNVLLYLRAEVVADVAARLFETLAPGGWLLTSPSDPPLRRYAPYVVRAGPQGLAYERPAPGATPRAAPVAGRPSRPAAPAAERPAVTTRRAAARGGSPIPRAVNTARVALTSAGPHKAPPDACPGCRDLVDAGRLPEALSLVDTAVARAPLAPELHLLRAIVMADLGALREAEAACRRAIFLARQEPFLHFFLATVLSRARDLAGASAALRTALRLAERLDPNEEIPWSEGMTAAELASAARWQLERHGAGVPAPP